jgi:hypothetical protein
MALFFVGVLQEFGGNALSIDASCHEVMPFVPKHAHQLGRERFIQEFDRCPQISGIAFSNSSVSMCLRARSRRVLMSVRNGLSATALTP